MLKVLISSKVRVHHQTIYLRDNSCLIGRHADGLSIPDRRCSRRHALLYLSAAGELRIRDLNSRNGTYVEGEPIRDRALLVGEIVQIGSTCFQIVEDGVTGNEPSSPSLDVAGRASQREVTQIVQGWPAMSLCRPG